MHFYKNKHKVHTSCDALEIYCKLTEAPAETQLRLSLALNVGSKIIHNPEIQGPKSFGFKTIQAWKNCLKKNFVKKLYENMKKFVILQNC